MKTNINIKNVLLMGITAAFLGMGCAWSQKLPSVTVGGAANKDAILDLSAGKEGVSVTAPLVNVDVPFPSVTAKDDKNKK
tara:strand:- start:350 stop:589 length:240 start_codon:yes stop_codon:yes gene_type:complete